MQLGEKKRIISIIVAIDVAFIIWENIDYSSALYAICVVIDMPLRKER